MEQMVRGSNVNISPLERWLSVIGGASLLMRGVRRDGIGWGSALLGADLIRRGASGHCLLYHALGITTAPRDENQRASIPYRQGIRVDEAIRINKPSDELYRFWRQLENLPRFMSNLISVSQLDEKRSRWVGEGPGGKRIEWDAEIINEVPGEVLGWRSLPGADVDSAGSVQFKSLPNDRGTLVTVELQYIPPGGIVTALSAKLFGEEPEQQVREDLQRLKQVMEAGEVRTDGGTTERASGDSGVRQARGVGQELADEAASGF
jgi:uncharacterized membrane protein